MAKSLHDPAVEQRGIKKGIEKTALAALKKGFDLEIIMDITGLDRNKLLELLVPPARRTGSRGLGTSPRSPLSLRSEAPPLNISIF